MRRGDGFAQEVLECCVQVLIRLGCGAVLAERQCNVGSRSGSKRRICGGGEVDRPRVGVDCIAVLLLGNEQVALDVQEGRQQRQIAETLSEAQAVLEHLGCFRQPTDREIRLAQARQSCHGSVRVGRLLREIQGSFEDRSCLAVLAESGVALPYENQGADLLGASAVLLEQPRGATTARYGLFDGAPLASFHAAVEKSMWSLPMCRPSRS